MDVDMDMNNGTVPVVLSRVKRHLSYVGYENFYTCYTNPELVTQDTVCHYVKTTKACVQLVNIFNYLSYLFCTMGLGRDELSHVIFMYSYMLILGLVYLFIMYVVGRYFIYSNIVMLSQHCNMFTYNFGVTVVMCVIVLPNTIYVLSSCQIHEQNGAILFIELTAKTFICFCAGIVTLCLKRHWTVPPKIFFLNMAMAGFGEIYLIEMMFFNMNTDHEPVAKRPSFNIHIHGVFMFFIYLIYLTWIVLHSKPNLPVSNVISETVSVNESLASDDYEKENPIDNEVDPWDIFFHSCNIFSNQLKSKFVFLVLMAPVWFVVSFLVPVVTATRPLNGWCKFQTITSLIAFPFLFYFLSNTFVYYALMMVCLLAAIMTMIGTDKKREPLHHFYYGLFGIVAGLTIFQTVDTELEALIWQILSFVADLDLDMILIMGTTLAPALYVSIFCYAMIQDGFPSMAYGMIMGVTLFFTYTSLPLMFFNGCPRDEKTAILSDVETTYYFLLITYSVFFLGVILSNFEFRMCHGLTILYLCVTYFIMLCDFVHPYGNQHATEIFRDVKHADWA